jgi:GAF domain-containing protein
MSERSDLQAAIAAGALAGDETHRALLKSIVTVACAIFHARAASVLLLDDATDELVFEAVTGEGEDTLVGRRFPSSTGIAGWVLVTRQSLVLDDVAQDPRFSSRFAGDTGYVPKGIMAVPLLHEERCLGVLEVLDRPEQSRFSLEELELLGLFGHQAAIALELMRRARAASSALDSGDPRMRLVASIAASVAATDDDDGELATRFLSSLDALLQRARENDDGDSGLERMI